MSGFKIIALKTNNGFDNNGKKGYKILSENTIFPFFNLFRFPNNDFTLLERNDDEETNVYEKSKRLKININAIVGSNGSGKSTILDMLLYVNYNIGTYLKLIEKCNCKKEEEKCNCSDVKNKELLSPNEFFSLQILYSDNLNKLKCLKFEYGNVTKYDYLKKGNTFKFIDEKPIDLTKSELENFCYSIVLNYSHHSLNSLEYGDWLNYLFHKNDGYQTPIVINPKREEGNFDINHENNLLFNRLLSNIFEPVVNGKEKESLRNIGNGKIVKSIKFTLNRFKTLKNEELDEEEFNTYTKESNIELATENFEDFLLNTQDLKSLKDNFGLDVEKLDKKNEYVLFGVNYIFLKVGVMVRTYKPYISMQKANTSKDLGKIFEFIRADKSHIAFKIKQAIYFLKYIDDWQPILKNLNEEIPVQSISTLLKKIKRKESKNDKAEELELLPPSFLVPKITLENGLDFDTLSSGEKQKIHSISSIVYHIINLNSIEKKPYNDEITKTTEITIKHKNIQVILDEIELYYHPEWQRLFISDLLSYIDKINSKFKKDIRTINFTFITHSPFILSDIPSQNILRLEEGKASKKEFSQTFGANIHDLLANDFFLSKGFMGEFAKDRINDVIRFLNFNQLENKISSLDTEIDKIERDRLTIQKDELGQIDKSLNFSKCEEIIMLIGEPAIRETLLRQYFELIEKNDDESKNFLFRLAEKLNYSIQKKK